MILGMTPLTFTHVVISLVGIAAGFFVIAGMLRSQRSSAMTAIFLFFTVLTSATGFLFPFTIVTPAILVGIVSLIILAVALAALYGFKLAGPWRPIYVVTAVVAQYLNVFVLVVQAFLKVGPLNDLAPTGSETPFLVAQGIVLLLFVAVGILALRRFHPRARLLGLGSRVTA